MTQGNRTLSLLRTLGSTAVRAGAEALKKQMDQGRKTREGRRDAAGQSDDEAEGSLFSGPSAAALRFVRGLDDLKGAAMKMGQLLSLADDSILPPGWKQALAKLQSQATARPFSEVEPLLRADVPHYETLLVELETVAVHAASIGQVHRGRLADGTRVAVKIRYPGLEKWVKSDIKALRRMLRLANALPSDGGDFDAVFEQVEKIFLQEIDFAQEAANYTLYREHFKDVPGVVVPRVIPELSTHHVLVTEWVDGVGIDAWLATAHGAAGEAGIRGEMSATVMRVLFQELFVLGRIQSDPNPANFLVTPEGNLALLDFGATQILEPHLVEGYRALSRACLRGSKAAILRVCEDMRFLKPTDSVVGRDAFVDMLQLATEPFEFDEYDFGKAHLMARMRTSGMTFVREVGFRPPPHEIVFLNRRIVGTQMLLERLAGRFDARAILMPHLK